MAERIHNGVIVAEPMAFLTASLDEVSARINQVLPSWQWLARTDEERGGFANITSPDFQARIIEGPLGFSQQTVGQTYKAYAATPAAALAYALELAEAAHRGIN